MCPSCTRDARCDINPKFFTTEVTEYVAADDGGNTNPTNSLDRRIRAAGDQPAARRQSLVDPTSKWITRGPS
jgi:hypothetical protein